MLTAYYNIDENKTKGIAKYLDKKDAPFYCPNCNETVTICKGNKKIHHFRHLSKTNCSYGGESEFHLQVKDRIYNTLLELKERGEYEEVELEHCLINGLDKVFARIDVYAVDSYGMRIAFEIQKTKISKEELIYRTRVYNQNDIYVCWIIPIKHTIHNQEYRLSKFEQTLNTMYGGKAIYYNYTMNSFETYSLKDVHRDSKHPFCPTGYICKTIKDISLNNRFSIDVLEPFEISYRNSLPDSKLLMLP